MVPGVQRGRRKGSTRRPAASPALLGVLAVLGAILVIQACTTRDITTVVVTDVSVTPPSARLVEGDTLRFRDVVTDDGGSALNGVPVEWTVDDPTIVSIDDDGLVTALSRGTTTIHAQFQGVSDEATVEVLAPPRIDVDPSELAFFGGVGGATIPSQDVSITNAGGQGGQIELDGLDFVVLYAQDQPADWLDVSLAGQSAPTTLTVVPLPAALDAGQYSADIEITSTNDFVTNSPVTIPVTLSLSDYQVEETDGSTVVDEAGSQDQFSVALGKAPSSDVVLTVTSRDTGEVTASPGTLTFTPDDWDVPQFVTVSGVDDFVDDGDVTTPVTISVDDASSDDAFDPTPDFDVVVTTVDDDTAGMIVAETDGSSVVTEGGGTDTLTVVLETEPASLVVIDVVSQDAGEATVTPDQLTFDASNWDVPQVVTLTGVDDSVIDGAVQTDVVVEVDTLATVGAYASVPKQTVSVTTEDDDAGAIVLSRDTAAVDETGATDSVMVTLSVMPDSAVVLAVTNDDPGEVSVSPDTLTFQPSEWNVGQAITFTGVDDPLSDGAQVATVTVSVVTDASDGDFSAAPDVTVAVTNADDDSAGFVVTETDDATTVSESGTTDDVQVVLTTQPRQDSVVVLEITSPDPGEVTVSPNSVTFDHTDWDQPRTVTVTGVDDSVDDGDQVTDVEVSVGAATTDPDYGSVPAQTVSVTTFDTRLVIEEVGGGTTIVSEFGGTDLIDVTLSHPPSSDVVVSVVSDDTGEVTVDVAQLTFTPGNWSTAQTVEVQGVDDAVDDGDVLTDVRLTVVNGSSDPIFHDVADTVQVTTTDNDGAGIDVIEVGGTVVSENGSTDQFAARLTAQPAPGTVVVLDVSSGDEGEVTVDKAQLTFTPADWDQQQTVTVTGVADNTVDGDQNTDVTISVNDAQTTDPAYPSVGDRFVGVTTQDVDVAAVTVNDASATEGGSVVFSVTLSNAVEGGLSVDVTLTDGTAVAPGDYDDNVATLNFAGTPGEVEQFSVSTVNDAIVEDDETFTVSLDASHPSVGDSDTATGTINDNDAAAVTVGNVSATEGSGLTFTVTLDNPVAGGLTVDVTLTDGTATGGAPPLVSPEDYDNVVGQLSFAGTAGEAEQFTVATLDDAVVEGSETFTVSLSASDASVDDNDTATGTIDDNDAAVVSVDNVSAEEGNGLTFTVTLDNAVAGGLAVDVTLTDGSATGGAAPLEAPEDYDNQVPTLNFAGTAGETEQFTVATLDDAIFEGAETFTVGLSASNGAVDDSDGGTGTITDNDSEPTVTLSADASTLAEDGSDSPASVTATLSNPTTQDVTVSLGFSGTASEGDDYTRTATQIVIPALSTTGSIEVDAVQDAVDEADETVIVDITGVTNGTEAGAFQQETITIVDDDAAGIPVTPTSGLVTDEAGGEDTFTVVLTSQPTGSVTVGLSSSDTGEGTVSPASLTFNPTGAGIWSTPQTVTVTGVDDDQVDGNITYTVVTAAASSSDPNYDGVDPSDVSVTNNDAGETAGFTVTPTSGLVTDEAGGEDTFTFALMSQPTSSVTVELSSSDTSEGTVSPTSLTFNPTGAGIWSTPQTVTVTGVDDDQVDGNITYTIVTAAASSSDPNYDGVDPSDVSVTNNDAGETAGFTVTPTSGLVTDETGGDDTFTVVLTSQPTGAVTIGLSSNDTSEGTVSPTSLTFNPTGAGIWSTPQTVTVTGVDDVTVDGDQLYTIVTAAASSSDPDYDGVDPSDVSVTNDDDDLVLGVPASVLIVTQPSSTAQSGVQFAQQPVVLVTDNGGNPVSGESVTATIVSGGGSLGGTVTINTTGAGLATYTNLSISGLVGDRRLQFSAGSVDSNPSNIITLEPGPLDQLVVSQQPSSTVTNDEPFPQQPTVTALDDGGNTLSGISVTAEIASGEGTLDGTLSANTDGSGVAAFTDLKITGTVGVRTLRFYNGAISMTSSSIDVVAGAPATIVMATQPPSRSVSGVVFTQSPVVEVEDVSGNLVPNQNVDVTIESGGGTLGGTTTVSTDGSGSATFSTLSITTSSPGPRTLGFAANGATASSSSVHVAYGQGTYVDLQYCGTDTQQRMDVFVPSNTLARPLPVGAFIHGGGWISGDKSSGTLYAEVRDELLSRGYVVVSLNYRLAESSPDVNQWPAQIHDVKCAVRHLRAEADDYGFDGVRIGAWGSSAGGHLVSMLGVTDAGSGLEGSEGYPGWSSRVSAAVPIGGISDVTPPAQDELNFPPGPETTFSTWPGPSTELTEASPVTWTTSDDPAFLIVHGDQDMTVDPNQATRLESALNTAGGDVTLQSVVNGGHQLQDVGAGTPTPSIAELTQQVSDFFDTHVRLAPAMVTSNTPGP